MRFAPLHGWGFVFFASILGIKHEVPVDLLVDVFSLRIPKKILRDGFQMDGDGFQSRSAVLRNRAVGPAPVMKDEHETAPLLLEDLFLDGIEEIIAGQLEIVFLGQGSLLECPVY